MPGRQFDRTAALRQDAAGHPLFPWLYSGDPLDYALQAALCEFYPGPMATGENLFSHQDARNLLSRWHAASRIDDWLHFDCDLVMALAQVQAVRMVTKPVIIPHAATRCRTRPTYLARELYRGIKNATYVEIPSYLGHLAGGPANDTSTEYVFVTAQIKKFLCGVPGEVTSIALAAPTPGTAHRSRRCIPRGSPPSGRACRRGKSPDARARPYRCRPRPWR